MYFNDDSTLYSIEVSRIGIDSPTSLATGFLKVWSLCVVRTGKDAGDVYFVDTISSKAYVWKPVSHNVTLVADNLSDPFRVAVDDENNLLYIYAKGLVIVDLATYDKYPVAGPMISSPHGWSVSQGKVIYGDFGGAKSFERTCPQHYRKEHGLCSPFSCFGIAASSSLVCSSQGECVDNDTCVCNSTYLGHECETQVATCSSISSTNSSVCSGHGNCMANDVCDCQIGWIGSDCQYHNCFGKEQTDPTACGGNGQCVNYDTCNCNSGWVGSECKNWECYGIINTNQTRVCSGHGTCYGTDTCVCSDDYSGDACEKAPVYCFGVLQTDGDVCSGKDVLQVISAFVNWVMAVISAKRSVVLDLLEKNVILSYHCHPFQFKV